jgi:hypothetical protein
MTATGSAAGEGGAGAGDEERREKLARIKAEVHRRWAALYGQLLQSASELHELGAETAEAAAAQPHPPVSSSPSSSAWPADMCLFPSLNVPPPTARERALLPDDPSAVRTYEQARPLFLEATKHLDLAKAFFTLDGGFVTDHAHLQREASKLYRHLSTFETVRVCMCVREGWPFLVLVLLLVSRGSCWCMARFSLSPFLLQPTYVYPTINSTPPSHLSTPPQTPAREASPGHGFAPGRCPSTPRGPAEPPGLPGYVQRIYTQP